MKTIIGGSHDEDRVGGDLVDVAKMVGLPTTDSLSVEGSPSDRVENTESHQEEKAFADPISEEDGISPDDAPEVILDDIDKEVRSITIQVPIDG